MGFDGHNYLFYCLQYASPSKTSLATIKSRTDVGNFSNMVELFLNFSILQPKLLILNSTKLFPSIVQGQNWTVCSIFQHNSSRITQILQRKIIHPFNFWNIIVLYEINRENWKSRHTLMFYLKKNRMAQRHVPFSWCHAPLSERHAPFDKKKRGAMYCRCALFRFFEGRQLWL